MDGDVCQQRSNERPRSVVSSWSAQVPAHDDKATAAAARDERPGGGKHISVVCMFVVRIRPKQRMAIMTTTQPQAAVSSGSGAAAALPPRRLLLVTSLQNS